MNLHRHQRFASIWDAIENTPAEAEKMRLRSALMSALESYIEKEGLTQAEAARLFGVTQPRVLNLFRGRINVFTIDALVAMLAAAGLQIEVNVRWGNEFASTPGPSWAWRV